MAVLLTAALLLPLTPHTGVELEAWYADWQAAPAQSSELLMSLMSMRGRHPCFPDVCLAVAVTPPDPVAAAAPSLPANSGMGGNVEQWRALTAAFFPADQVDRALRVMACESGGNPNAYNPSGATGLMQVLASWADNFGLVPAQLFDPAINLQVARYLWDDGGWGHWRASQGCW